MDLNSLFKISTSVVRSDLNPNFSASPILLSSWGIDLSSPDKPISAAKHMFLGKGMSW